MSNLRDTLVEELQDLYDAEKQIQRALPKLVAAAKNEELKATFESHLQETEGQIGRLEKVFELLGEEARGKKCKGMQGLIAEGEERIAEEAGDAALICAAQKVEHYEIATYGSLVAWAALLEEDEVVEQLEESLNEEEQADERLTQVAENAVNVEEAEEEAAAGREEE